MMKPIMIIAPNDLWIPANPPLAITEAASTEPPIKAPPVISKTVVNFDFSLKPIAKDRKNKIIEDVPNIIPRWAALIGRKP